MDGFGGEPADQIDLLLAVGLAVGAKNFVEPLFGLPIGVGLLPGVPRQPGLRFACHQTPVDGRNSVLLRDGEDAPEGAVVGPSHVFGAEDGAVILLQPVDSLSECGRFAIVVE